MHYLNRRR